MNPDQLPTVSTFRVEKPGKSKFAPSIGGRKSKDHETTSTAVPAPVVTDLPEVIENEPANPVVDESFGQSLASPVTAQTPQSPSAVKSTPVSVGKKIESIQSRRMTANSTVTTANTSANTTDQSIKLPSGPKDAATIATTASTGSVIAEKRTMAYFLKDTGEGREMPTSSNSTGGDGSDPLLSPSKTRRIVNLRNIKAPPRSAATSTALAPQVRVVDGAIVYDEKFSAAISIPSASPSSDIEQELEYVDEDDENGKHLTSATYSTRAKGSNRWNPAETDLFYEALSMCGTDFSMIQTLFPYRTRAQIKGKYKLEEKSNPQRINAALREKRTFDPSFKDRVEEIRAKNKK